MELTHLYTCRLVFTMLKVATIHPCTMKRVYEVLKWSFDALAKGKFPAEDPWGTKFCNKYMPERARNAGHALAKRADGELYRGAFAEFRGGWKYLKEAFCLADNYGNHDFICHRCQARKLGSQPGMSYSNFCRTAEHRSAMVSNAEFKNRYAQVSPLVLIIGMHITRIVFDKMHCMELGVLQLLIPSLLGVLLRFCSPRYPSQNRDERYAHAFKRYRFWCNGERKVHTLVKKKFTSKVWATGEAGYPRIGQTVAKAAAIRGLSYWVEHELREDLADMERRTPAAGSPAARAAGAPAAARAAKELRLKSLQLNCIYGFCEADRICRRAGRYFTAEQHA